MNTPSRRPKSVGPPEVHHTHAGPDPATDPILSALGELTAARDQLDERIRVLIAYARECTYPRPYRLADLAQATGLSISGTRASYTTAHIQAARRLHTPAAASDPTPPGDLTAPPDPVAAIGPAPGGTVTPPSGGTP